MAEKIDTSFVINTPEGLLKDNDRGCTERIKKTEKNQPFHPAASGSGKEQKIENRCLQKSTKVP